MRRLAGWSWGSVVVTGLVLAVACGESTDGDDDGAGGDAGADSHAGAGAGASEPIGDAGRDSGGSLGEAGQAGATGQAGSPACAGLQCQVPICGLLSTRILGTVLDPSGTLPLYGATVSIPNAPVPELTAGPACDRCGESDVPSVVKTVTGVDGTFVLDDVPAGNDIPVVIQMGKWRRQLTLPRVVPCVDHDLLTEQTRLPRNKSEGDIPRIALSTGGQDQLECFLRRLGIDDAEFTTNSGDGRIHLYAGAPNPYTPGISQFAPSLNGGAALTKAASTLWAQPSQLEPYDLVLLACEGSSSLPEKPIASRQALYDYAAAGGRVLASHWHHVWLSAGPPAVAPVATWSDRDDPTSDGTSLIAKVHTDFEKGQMLADWLVQVDASSTAGSLSIVSPRDNVQAVNPTLSREWLSAESPRYPAAPHTVQYFSFTTPVGAPAAEACGRFAFSAVHVSTPLIDGEQPGFPMNCEERVLSPQERAIAFQLFELTSCIAPEDVP